MQPIKLCIFLGLVFGGAAAPVLGQARLLTLDTNHPDANVYADSTWLGLASQGLFDLPAGTSVISLVASAADDWSVPALTRTVKDLVADTLRLEMRFPYYYNLESVPSGTHVYHAKISGRELLGKTPLRYMSEEPLSGELIFDRDGYLARSVMPEHEIWNRHFVMLDTIGSSDPSLSDLSFSRPKSTKWIDYVAVGTIIAGGVLAVHYKTKANHRYDEYNESRNPSIKSDVKRLDVYSGISLTAMQIGLGVIAIRLVF